MTAEALHFLSGFFARIWTFFTGWYLPGTNVTPIAWALFLAISVIFIKTFKRLLNTPDSSASGSFRKGGDS